MCHKSYLLNASYKKSPWVEHTLSSFSTTTSCSPGRTLSGFSAALSSEPSWCHPHLPNGSPDEILVLWKEGEKNHIETGWVSRSPGLHCQTPFPCPQTTCHLFSFRNQAYFSRLQLWKVHMCLCKGFCCFIENQHHLCGSLKFWFMAMLHLPKSLDLTLGQRLLLHFYVIITEAVLFKNHKWIVHLFGKAKLLHWCFLVSTICPL